MSAPEAIHTSEGRMNDSGDPDEYLNGIACVGGGETKESASCDRVARRGKCIFHQSCRRIGRMVLEAVYPGSG